MKNRVFGLDLMRATAILSVLYCHYSSPVYPFFSGMAERMFNMTNWLTGYFGVEIFFVLSGFLIGTIYLKTQNDEQPHPYSSVVVFLKRRWFRTLPNYVLFVLLNVILIVSLGGPIKTASVLKTLFFVQKINIWEELDFFGVSWSLAVEEWFYFLMPVTFLLLFSFSRKWHWALNGSVWMLLLIPFIAKIGYCFTHPVLGDHEEVFRYATFFRLDAIFTGVFFAKLWLSGTYRNRIQNQAKQLSGIGIILLLISFVYAYVFLVKPQQYSFLYALYSPLCCLAIVCFLPSLLRMPSAEGSFTGRIIYFISTCSYSLYLAHVPVKQLCDYFVRPYFDAGSIMWSLLYIVLMLLISFSVSFFIYRNFELKILQYRDRVVKEPHARIAS